MSESIRVLLVESQAIVRIGLAEVLGNEPGIVIVGEAGDGAESVLKAVALQPDVILTEVYLPGLGGLEAILRIKEKLPLIRVLVLTFSEREEDSLEALKLGVDGYLLKSASLAEICDALKKVAAGQPVLSACYPPPA